MKEISEKLNLYYPVERFLADGSYFDFEFCDDIDDVFEHLESGLEKAKKDDTIKVEGYVDDAILTAKDEVELEVKKNKLFKIIEESINTFILTLKDNLPGEPEDSYFYYYNYTNELYGREEEEPFEVNQKYKFLIGKWLNCAIDEGVSDLHFSSKVYNFLDGEVFCPNKSVTSIAVESNYGNNVAFIYKKYCTEVEDDAEITLEVNNEVI